MTSVFSKYIPRAYPYNYRIRLHVPYLVGGTPTNPNVAAGWLKKKLGVDDDELIRQAVSEVMLERNMSAEEAAKYVQDTRLLNGFKRDANKGLYIEGRQAKAAIKEAANVRWPKERWGPSRKGTLSFWAEHVFVPEDRIYLGVNEPTDVIQRFVHTWRGNAIQYEEYVADADVEFTVTTDNDFSEEQWALLWLTGEQQGIGASRSQGFGRYEVTRWEQIDPGQ